MTTTRRRVARAFALAAAAALVALAALPACGPDRACFEWTAAQGDCPAQEDALTFFGGLCSDVASVDSGPELLDGTLCCYDVTNFEGTRTVSPSVRAMCTMMTTMP
ncbi:MAG TPA: hypothetical protein VGM56_14800 [Byssovorax sp.]